jgi:hypothetical protein
MATNYGMLNNIASGVKEAMTAYQTNKTLQRQEQMQNLLQGARENPETGELEYTDEMKMKKDAEMRGLIGDKNRNDLMSQESKAMQEWGKANGIPNADKLNAAQIEKLIPTVTTRMNNDASYKRAGLLDQYKKEITDEKQSTGDYEFKKLPKDAQIKIDTLSKDSAKQTVMGNQVGELIGQMKDPNMSVEDKVASANEQVKLLNSTLGADAVGAEEVKRIAKFLDYAPSPTVGKYSVGPDIEGYTRQLENLKKRTDGSIGLLKSQVDAAYGRKAPDVSGQVNPDDKGLIKKSAGQTAIPIDRVTVMSPDGKVGHIPRSQLQDALKQGFKEQK